MTIIETALQMIRDDLQQMKPSSPVLTEQQRLVAAAEALLQDYMIDDDLTSFTALDGEEFHA